MKLGVFEKWISYVQDMGRSRQGLMIMILVCFCEPIFLPLFPELVIAPVLLARPSERLIVFLLAWGSTLLGVTCAYGLASFAGQFLLSFFGQPALYLYEKGLIYLKLYGFFLPFLGSATPFPLKVITWTCGLTLFNFPFFLFSVALGRLLRYSLIFLLQKTHENREKIRIQFNPRRLVSTHSVLRRKT